MPIEVIDTPEGTITIETRPTGDGQGQATTSSFTPKPGTRLANERALRDKAIAAQTANATYLALASPTNAQNAAQVERLTRQVNALIRLVIGQLDDVAGT